MQDIHDQREVEITHDTSIDALNISKRAKKCLAMDGIKTIADLHARTEMGLLHIPDFGWKCLKEVRPFRPGGRHFLPPVDPAEARETEIALEQMGKYLQRREMRVGQQIICKALRPVQLLKRAEIVEVSKDGLILVRILESGEVVDFRYQFSVAYRVKPAFRASPLVSAMPSYHQIYAALKMAEIGDPKLTSPDRVKNVLIPILADALYRATKNGQEQAVTTIEGETT